MRVLVCGGRDFDDRPMLVRVLDMLHEQHNFSVVIHGAARGADRLADYWAVTNRLPVFKFHANWKMQGLAAGPIRNAKMLEKGRPDLVVAFPGNGGTKNMVRQALTAKVEVRKVRADGTVERWLLPEDRQGELFNLSVTNAN